METHSGLKRVESDLSLAKNQVSSHLKTVLQPVYIGLLVFHMPLKSLHILSLIDIDASMLHNARASEFVIIKACEVKEAIEKLQLHKCDGSFMLSSDHFVNAGFDLSIHISFYLQL